MFEPPNISVLKAFRGSKHLLTRYWEDFGCLGFGILKAPPEASAFRASKLTPPPKVPGTGLSSILVLKALQKKALSTQNKGHLGSRYVFEILGDEG